MKHQYQASYNYCLVVLDTSYMQLGLLINKKNLKVYLDYSIGYANKFKWIIEYKCKVHQVGKFYFGPLVVWKANNKEKFI